MWKTLFEIVVVVIVVERDIRGANLQCCDEINDTKIKITFVVWNTSLGVVALS
jgi:hypothetical protein